MLAGNWCGGNWVRRENGVSFEEREGMGGTSEDGERGRDLERWKGGAIQRGAGWENRGMGFRWRRSAGGKMQVGRNWQNLRSILTRTQDKALDGRGNVRYNKR